MSAPYLEVYYTRNKKAAMRKPNQAFAEHVAEHVA